MVYGILLTTFLKSVKGKNEKSGERVYNNDLVLSPELIIDENNVIIDGRVISESLYSEYTSKIYINTKGELYSPPVCTCNDYEKGALKHSFFACKHINAQFLYFLNMLQRDDTLYSLFKNDEEPLTTESSSMEILDVLAPSEKKEKIKFEVYINRREFDRNIYVYFKIGSRDMKSSSLYTLKDIDAFLTYINNNIPLKYGKDFILDLSTQEMNGEALNILSFIKLIKNLDSSNTFKRSQDKYIQGKFLFIPKAMVRSFLEGIQNTRIYLEEGFFYRPVESEVIKSNIPVSFLIRESENEIILEIHGPTPKELNENGDGYLYNGSIYLPTYDQVKSISPYLKLYNDVKGICFPKSQEETVLRRIIPSVQRISNDVILDNKLKDRVVLVKPKYKFYFDRDKEIKLTYKVDYNGIEFNYFHEFTDKIIFRDTVNENKVFNLIESIGLTVIKDYFVFNINDEDIYSFFLGEIEKLQDVGEVFYSQHFKGIKLLNSRNFNVTVRKGKHNYFNFEFNIDSISDKEFRSILRAFRNNKKYYKLDNGEFINLEELELNKLLTLISNCTKDIENTTIMDLNKAPYFSEYVDKYNLNYFSGLTALKKVYKKFNEYNNLKLEIPSSLNATLREYQIQGVKWIKMLRDCNYGGILGDQMGLGKTIQMITYLLLNPNENSLVIAPTSLIYNWEKEFKKFAPLLDVYVLNDERDKREEIINNYKNYNVLITTYNLIRRDKDLYDECYFDNIILDEAQNIKNSNSQNAIAVKGLNSKCKFAMTGTPLENSLMELWSIFDFIMPEYLYDKKTFETRYFRRLDEEEVILKEIKALIKPFILRRTKKNVIKELPDKIEKTIELKMTDKQFEVYGAYSSYIKELIMKKVKDDEFSQSKIEILSYITKLRQLAINPSLVMEEYDGGSGKLNGAIEVIKECVDEGHKILLFSQFSSALNDMKNLCVENDISYYYLDGGTLPKRRIEMVENFNKDNTNIFLISLKAGGAGLNLTAADIVIHLDPWWNPAVEDQATDRAHRIGQENVVEVIKLISKDTIEEKVVDMQLRKKEIINKILDEKDLTNMSQYLSEEDILHLF